MELVLDNFHAVLLAELGSLVGLEQHRVHVSIGLASAVVSGLAAGCQLVTALLLIACVCAHVLMRCHVHLLFCRLEWGGYGTVSVTTVRLVGLAGGLLLKYLLIALDFA